ncbi:response regulator [Dyadobacter sandarakinus]|uniref:Response regulator n=2 Tax=Dyadobacter sandarakinus TaxID=2747268 RepID=A0ABX7IE74_9BACT|nr:response regulator [Dyadobacter sandarakinus]
MLDTLCVIDDDPVFTFLLKKMIEKAQVTRQTLYFENGQEAIDFLEANREQPGTLPQLILLDINMPILDGWQFLDEYAVLHRELARNIPIFMTSSSTDPEDYKRALASEFIIDYVRKPIYVKEIQSIVGQASVLPQ